MSVGYLALQKIVDALAARNYTICNLCTPTSFGHSAPLKYAEILHWQYRVIVVALSVSGWHLRVHSVLSWNAHLNVCSAFIVDPKK